MNLNAEVNQNVDRRTDRQTDRRTSSIHKPELLCNPAKYLRVGHSNLRVQIKTTRKSLRVAKKVSFEPCLRPTEALVAVWGGGGGAVFVLLGQPLSSSG